MRKVQSRQTIGKAADTYLPKGWTLVQAADVCEINPRKPHPDALPADEPVTFVPMAAVDDDLGAITAFENHPFGQLRSKSYTSFAENDVLLAKITPCMENGKSALARGLTNKLGFGSTEFHVFRSMGAVLPEYLYHYIRQQSFRDDAQAHMTGTAGHLRVPADYIEGFKLPLAPLAEQERIVVKVEALLERVNAARARLAKTPAILKRFRQSVLAAACSGRLTEVWREIHPETKPAGATIEAIVRASDGPRLRMGIPNEVPVPDDVRDWEMPDTWASCSAAELLKKGVLEDLKDGNHGANHPKVSEFTEDGLPFITAAQVNNLCIDYEGAYKISGEPLNRLRVGFAKSGDVIYTHKGSVGRVAIAEKDCMLTPQTTYYRPRRDTLVPRYLMLFLASPFFARQVDVVKEQTTRDFVPISEQYLLFHRIPPVEEQHEIVRRVESLFSLIDTIEKQVATAITRTEKLPQSILAKAFRGELLPTEAQLAAEEGRDYEPASVLLERIQESRKQNKPVGRVRGGNARVPVSHIADDPTDALGLSDKGA